MCHGCAVFQPKVLGDRPLQWEAWLISQSPALVSNREMHISAHAVCIPSTPSSLCLTWIWPH